MADVDQSPQAPPPPRDRVARCRRRRCRQNTEGQRPAPSGGGADQ